MIRLALLFVFCLMNCSFLFSEETTPADGGAEVRYAILTARSFNVVPDTEKDMGPAFRKMIATVVSVGTPVEIQLEEGVYRIGGGPSYDSAIGVEGASNLRIRGMGTKTEIVLTNPRQGGFFVADSVDVWVENLAIDHDPIPYTQGHIMLVNVEEGWFDFITQQNYPSLAEPWFAEAPKPYGQWGMIFDPVEPRLKADAADFIFMDSWERLGKRAWRMHPVKDQRERLKDVQYGDRFVYMARHGKGGAVFFYRSADSGVRNIMVYASQSLAVGSVASDRITVDGMRVLRRPDTDRLLSTNSDGVHCQQNIRGPIIENCSFEGMADDGINIYYYPNTITGIVSDTVIRVSRHGIIEAGDLLQFFEPQEGRVVAEVTAAEVGSAPDGEYRITLAAPVPGIRAAPDGHSIYNLSRCGAGYVIRNNEFKNHRRHGMMLKAPHGLVEKNILNGLGGLGIVAGNDPEWPEGVIPTDLTIRNNSIKDVGRSRWYGQDTRGAAIQLVTRASGGRLASGRYLQNVVLENNVIVNPPGAALYLGAVQNVAANHTRVIYRSDAVMPRAAAAVIVEDATGIRLYELTIESQQPKVVAGVLIGETVDKGESGIMLNGIHISGVPGIKPVIDQR